MRPLRMNRLVCRSSTEVPIGAPGTGAGVHTHRVTLWHRAGLALCLAAGLFAVDGVSRRPEAERHHWVVGVDPPGLSWSDSRFARCTADRAVEPLPRNEDAGGVSVTGTSDDLERVTDCFTSAIPGTETTIRRQ